MYNCILKNLIEQFRNHEVSVFTIIYDEFKRLIYFYSGKLCDDDAVGELTLFLIEILYNIPLSKFEADKSDTIKRYIAVSLKNKYISLSKQNQLETALCSELFDGGQAYSKFEPLGLELTEALETLSKKQRLIIVYKYIYCYTDFEISHILNISRQAVNRLKNRALATLREFYQEYH